MAHRDSPYNNPESPIPEYAAPVMDAADTNDAVYATPEHIVHIALSGASLPESACIPEETYAAPAANISSGDTASHEQNTEDNTIVAHIARVAASTQAEIIDDDVFDPVESDISPLDCTLEDISDVVPPHPTPRETHFEMGINQVQPETNYTPSDNDQEVGLVPTEEWTLEADLRVSVVDVHDDQNTEGADDQPDSDQNILPNEQGRPDTLPSNPVDNADQPPVPEAGDGEYNGEPPDRPYEVGGLEPGQPSRLGAAIAGMWQRDLREASQMMPSPVEDDMESTLPTLIPMIERLGGLLADATIRQIEGSPYDALDYSVIAENAVTEQDISATVAYMEMQAPVEDGEIREQTAAQEQSVRAAAHSLLIAGGATLLDRWAKTQLGDSEFRKILLAANTVAESRAVEAADVFSSEGEASGLLAEAYRVAYPDDEQPGVDSFIETRISAIMKRGVADIRREDYIRAEMENTLSAIAGPVELDDIFTMGGVGAALREYLSRMFGRGVYDQDILDKAIAHQRLSLQSIINRVAQVWGAEALDGSEPRQQWLRGDFIGSVLLPPLELSAKKRASQIQSMALDKLLQSTIPLSEQEIRNVTSTLAELIVRTAELSPAELLHLGYILDSVSRRTLAKYGPNTPDIKVRLGEAASSTSAARVALDQVYFGALLDGRLEEAVYDYRTGEVIIVGPNLRYGEVSILRRKIIQTTMHQLYPDVLPSCVIEYPDGTYYDSPSFKRLDAIAASLTEDYLVRMFNTETPLDFSEPAGYFGDRSGLVSLRAASTITRPGAFTPDRALGEVVNEYLQGLDNVFLWFSPNIGSAEAIGSKVIFVPEGTYQEHDTGRHGISTYYGNLHSLNDSPRPVVMRAYYDDANPTMLDGACSNLANEIGGSTQLRTLTERTSDMELHGLRPLGFLHYRERNSTTGVERGRTALFMDNPEGYRSYSEYLYNPSRSAPSAESRIVHVIHSVAYSYAYLHTNELTLQGTARIDDFGEDGNGQRICTNLQYLDILEDAQTDSIVQDIDSILSGFDDWGVGDPELMIGLRRQFLEAYISRSKILGTVHDETFWNELRRQIGIAD